MTEKELFDGRLPLAPTMGSGLSKAEELLWFQRRDFALHMTSVCVESKLEMWQKRLQHCRNYLCGANMAIAASFAVKFSQMSRANSVVEDELLSEAREALMRAVDKFNVDMKTRFGTFAWSVLRRAVTRKAAKETEQRRRFNPASEALLRRGDIKHAEAQELSENVEELNNALENCPLSLAERNVIQMRFHGKQTLEAIGGVLGLSKERIRQIQESALGKLRVEMGVKPNVD